MRRKANVPSKEIEIGGVYAVGPDDNLSRFKVEEVVTRRLSNTGSPHDYRSHVVGLLMEGSVPFERVIKDVSALRGKFTEYAELVQRQAAERAAYQAKRDAENAARDELVRLLLKLAGQEPPADLTDRDLPIRASYGTSVEIVREGVDQLLAVLRNAVVMPAEAFAPGGNVAQPEGDQ